MGLGQRGHGLGAVLLVIRRFSHPSCYVLGAPWGQNLCPERRDTLCLQTCCLGLQHLWSVCWSCSAEMRRLGRHSKQGVVELSGCSGQCGVAQGSTRASLLSAAGLGFALADAIRNKDTPIASNPVVSILFFRVDARGKTANIFTHHRT